MIRFWCIIYYFVHRADYKLSLLFRKVIGLEYLFSRPAVKNFYKKRGADASQVFKAVDMLHERPDFGVSARWAYGVMLSLVFTPIMAFISFFVGIFQIDFTTDAYPFVIVGLISYGVNEWFLFRHRKYLRYYKKMERMSWNEKKKWAWLSLAAVLGIWLLSIGCIVFMALWYKPD